MKNSQLILDESKFRQKHWIVGEIKNKKEQMRINEPPPT